MKRINVTHCSMFLTQWTAVKMYLSEIREPPHRKEYFEYCSYPRAACNSRNKVMY